MLIICGSGKKHQNPDIMMQIQLSEELDCIISAYFLLPQVLLEGYKVIQQLLSNFVLYLVLNATFLS